MTNQISAISKHLLEGNTISIMNGFRLFFCTNIPREIGRSIERKFNVEVSRTPKKFKSRYGKSGTYMEYRLNKTEYNKPGIEKMKEYIQKNIVS